MQKAIYENVCLFWIVCLFVLLLFEVGGGGGFGGGGV